MGWPERIEYRVDDRVLVVDRAGLRGPRAPHVVLVHGIGAGPTYFGRLARALVGRARLDVLELPGHASAAKPARPLSVDEHAALVSTYLERTDATDVVLVGHSMGAQVAARVATRDPARVARLLLLGPVVDPEAPTAAGQAWRLFLDTLRESPGANYGVFRDYLRCGVRWYAATLPAMLGFDTLAEAARLRRTGVWTTVVRGARDPIAGRDWCRALAAAAGSADVVEFPGSAHVVQWTAARRVADEILGGVR